MAEQQDSNLLLTSRGITFPRLPASVGLDPASIERFCVLLHIVYAHKKNPQALEVTQKEQNQTAITRHHKQAMEYLQAVLVKNDRVFLVQEIDGHRARYIIEAKGDRKPLVVVVDPTKSFDSCLAVQTPDGSLADIDFGKVTITV